MAGESAFGTELLMHLIPPLPIIVADAVNDEFEVDGDYTAVFLNGVEFRVVGSTGNDGVYTCDGASTYDGGGTHRTTITVNEDVTSAVADGNVERCPAIANVTNISGPGFGMDVVDVTAHDSASGAEEVVPTVLRTGELTIDFNYDPAEPTHAATEGLLYQLVDRELCVFELVLPDLAATVQEFSAYVTKFTPGAPFDGKLSASVTLKLSGVPTLA